MAFVYLISGVAAVWLLAIGPLAYRNPGALITKLSAVDLANCSAAIIVTFVLATEIGITPWTAAAYAAAGSFSMFITAALIRRTVTGPLNDLKALMKQVASGDLDGGDLELDEQALGRLTQRRDEVGGWQRRSAKW